MSTWSVSAYRPREHEVRSETVRFLLDLGYRLVMGETGGVWLVGRHGTQWFETWQAAARSVGNGTCALAKLEERLRQ